MEDKIGQLEESIITRIHLLLKEKLESHNKWTPARSKKPQQQQHLIQPQTQLAIETVQESTSTTKKIKRSAAAAAALGISSINEKNQKETGATVDPPKRKRRKNQNLKRSEEQDQEEEDDISISDLDPLDPILEEGAAAAVEEDEAEVIPLKEITSQMTVADQQLMRSMWNEKPIRNCRVSLPDNQQNQK